MLEPSDAHEPDIDALEKIYAQAPRGALFVAGVATGLVFALWLAFYLLIFIPRGFLE